jgi:phospholipase C
MKWKHLSAYLLNGTRAGLAAIAMLQFSLIGPFVPTSQAQESGETKTPIKHVIIIVGENRSFDHLFATYVPKTGETVDNLLSKGIVKGDGTPPIRR